MKILSELRAFFSDRVNLYYVLALLCIAALVLVGMK